MDKRNDLKVLFWTNPKHITAVSIKKVKGNHKTMIEENTTEIPEISSGNKVGCSDLLAKVVKYPTGYLALEYAGFKFYYSTQNLSKILRKLGELNIELSRVKFEEHYFTGPAGLRSTQYLSRPYDYTADLS